MEVTYEAISRLTRLKAKYGQISQSLARVQTERIEQALALEQRIDEIMKSGHTEKLVALKPEMDRVNGFRAVQHRQLEIPLGLVRLRYLSSLWQALVRER